MNSETIVICVVALILGMLLANMLKSVCGCEDVVEGLYLARWYGGAGRSGRAQDSDETSMMNTYAYPYFYRVNGVMKTNACAAVQQPILPQEFQDAESRDKEVMKYTFDNGGEFWANDQFQRDFQQAYSVYHTSDHRAMMYETRNIQDKCWGHNQKTCQDYVEAIRLQINPNRESYPTYVNYPPTVAQDGTDSKRILLKKWYNTTHSDEEPGLCNNNTNAYQNFPIETCVEAGLDSDENCAAAADRFPEDHPDRDKIYSAGDRYQTTDDQCPGEPPGNGMIYDINLRKCKHSECCRGPQKCHDEDSYWVMPDDSDLDPSNIDNIQNRRCREATEDEVALGLAEAGRGYTLADIPKEGETDIQCSTGTCNQDECCKASESCNCIDPESECTSDDSCRRLKTDMGDGGGKGSCTADLKNAGCYKSSRGIGNCGDWAKIDEDGNLTPDVLPAQPPLPRSRDPSSRKYENENECLLHKYDPHRYYYRKNMDSYEAIHPGNLSQETLSQAIADAITAAHGSVADECGHSNTAEIFPNLDADIYGVGRDLCTDSRSVMVPQVPVAGDRGHLLPVSSGPVSSG